MIVLLDPWIRITWLVKPLCQCCGELSISTPNISKAIYTLDRWGKGGWQHLEAWAIAPSRHVVWCLDPQNPPFHACVLAFEVGTSGCMFRFPASSLHVMSTLGIWDCSLLGASIGDFWPSCGVFFVFDACDRSLFGVSVDNFPSALHGSDWKVLEGWIDKL